MQHTFERITSEFAKIDGTVDLLHRVQMNLTKRNNLYNTNDVNHIEDLIW